MRHHYFPILSLTPTPFGQLNKSWFECQPCSRSDACYIFPGFCSFAESDYLLFLFGFRFETVDLTTRLLIPIIVLHNHNRYNVIENGHNYSINVEEIESEVSYSLHETFADLNSKIGVVPSNFPVHCTLFVG